MTPLNSFLSHLRSEIRPHDRLLAGALDPLNLPAPGELDELLERVALLDEQISYTRDAMGAQIRVLTRQLETANAENARLAAMASLAAATPAVAHDLNTALCNVALVSQSLDEEVGAFRGKLEAGSLRRADMLAFLEALETGLTIVGSAGGRARTLTAGLKNMAIASVSDRADCFHLADVVDDVLSTLQPSIRKRSASCHNQVPADLMLESFPGPLGQVLMNLVQNALVHGFEGKSGGCVKILGELDDESVEITVEDDGAGMSAAVLERAVEAFFTTKAGAGGSGIGLNSVRRLVEMRLGGSMGIASQPGVGTSVSLRLPRQRR
jgi:signal transduction histidine kinase